MDLESVAGEPLAASDGLRVLFLTHYDRIGAPSRYRFYQYFPRLRAAGISPRVDFIQSNPMCIRRQRGQRRLWFAIQVVFAYLRRMALLAFQGTRYPVWVIEKELFPALPWWLERLFLRRGVKLIVDYDDAVFLKYDSGRLSWLCGGKLAKLMQRVDVVFSGNEYITEYARKAGARDIRWVPSVIDESKYGAPAPHRANPPVIGWMGSYQNSRHILTIVAALRRLAAEVDYVVRIVGGAQIPLPPEIRAEYRPWTEEGEIQQLREFTVGIMPLEDGEWEKGKCGLKLIQYLAAGVPVVATPIGINRDIVIDGVNGFAASSEDEWLDALRRVLQERARGGFAGEVCAQTVQDRFTLAALAPTFVRTIHGLAAPSAR